MICCLQFFSSNFSENSLLLLLSCVVNFSFVASFLKIYNVHKKPNQIRILIAIINHTIGSQIDNNFAELAITSMILSWVFESLVFTKSSMKSKIRCRYRQTLEISGYGTVAGPVHLVGEGSEVYFFKTFIHNDCSSSKVQV